MPRDSQTKLSNKEISKRSKKMEEMNKKKKIVENSESSSNDGSESESESGEMDVHEYRKFISKIFPSKHLNNKIKSGEKLKKISKELSDYSESEEEVHSVKKSKKTKKIESSDEEVWETGSDEEEEVQEKKIKKSKKSKKSKKIEVSETDENEEISLGDEDTEEEDEEDTKFAKKGKGKLNIILTIGGMNKDEEEWEDEEWEDDSDDDSDIESEDDTEDEDEEVSTDESEDDTEDEEELENFKKKKLSKKSNKNDENEDAKSSEILSQLKKLLESNPTDKSIQKCINVYEEDIIKSQLKLEKKENKQKDKNMRIFKKIIKDKNTMNDFSFYKKLEMDQQKKIIKELREINKITRIEKPYRMTLLESEMPVEFKSSAMKKINSLRYMEPGSGEFYKSKNWVDTFMRIPFNKYKGLPVSIDDGVDKCHEFMSNAQNTLDQAVYGLNDAKMQIMQMLGQLLTNPNAIGTAIAIHGPPGTGKTSLVKEGISKILNRPFAFIALGGATDSSFLEGHGYTYEGSTWGKIVQILIDSKCMNPVIYFDELDKISDTPRGEEIAGILTHLTDTSQNSQFHDKYFSDINFDLSKCLFIFSYNDESKVNPILKDRMYRIKTKGYISKEKTVIANNYLLPRIREQVRFNIDEISIPNEVLSHIIDTHCNKEDGVRNLKRCLEIIYTKLNLYRLMKPGSNLFEGEMSLKVEFPFSVTKEIVDKLIKRESDGLETWRSLYL